MDQFILPDGYTRDIPPEISAQDTIPPYGLYGGADFSQASDAAGVRHIACCARRASDNWFGFMVFRNTGGSTWVEQRLSPPCTGRGEISTDHWTGAMRWGAWEGNSYFMGDVPGAAPFMTYIELLDGMGVNGAPGVVSGLYVPVAADDKYVRLWFGKPIPNGTTQVLVPGQGPSLGYAMRVTVEGPVGAMARLGPNAMPETALTARVDALTHGKAVGRGYDKGTINAADDGTIVLYAEGGATAIWVDMDASFKK